MLICLFLTLRDWKVVAYGAKKGAGYVFKDMARNAVYLPVFIPRIILLLIIL